MKRTTPLAVFACLPPTVSAIGKYTFESFISSEQPVHFFSAQRTSADWIACKHQISSQKKPHSLYHIDVFTEAHAIHNYHDGIFVLGNSHHHDPAIKALFKYAKTIGINKHLYIHEAQLTCSLLPLFSDHGSLLNFYRLHYPEKQNALTSFESIFENKIYGLRVITALTDPTSIITNSNACSQIAREETQGLLCRPAIHNLFLPMTRKYTPVLRKQENIIRVGSFGIPHRVKHLDTVVEACEILVKHGQKLQLVLAGPDVSQFLRRHRLRKNFITAIDSPNDEQMVNLMQSVDVGIQLRWPSHGESSACINELLALQKRVIATNTGSFSDLRNYVTLTDVEVSPDELAFQISKALRSEPDFSSYENHYSTREFQTKLQSFIGSLDS